MSARRLGQITARTNGIRSRLIRELRGRSVHCVDLRAVFAGIDESTYRRALTGLIQDGSIEVAGAYRSRVYRLASSVGAAA